MIADPTAARRGIALLISLIILALLAVFMTEFAFDTNLETRGIRNFHASFQARNAAKSLFKATLIGIQGGHNQELSERDFFDSINPPQFRVHSILNPAKPEKFEAIQLLLPGLAKSFPNVIFYTPYIRPIDHLFNLNRIDPKNTPEKGKDLKIRNEFSNILQTTRISWKQERDLPEVTSGLSTDEIQIIYASIYDWSDRDDEQTYVGSSIELYKDVDTMWQVKNARFDRIEEILLLQHKLVNEGYLVAEIPLRSETPEADSWERYFTTHPVGVFELGEDSPRINVNLATEEEIWEYLNRFINMNVSQSDKDLRYLSRAKDIGSVLQPGFPETSYSYKSFNEVKAKLRGDPATSDLDDYHKKYFILFSNWYEIQLTTEIENVRAEVRAVVQVNRESNSGKVKKDSDGNYELTIHDFQLR